MTDVTTPVQQNDEASPDAPVATGTPVSGDEQGEKLVPVTEAIRYRKRAQAAEQQIGELNGRLDQLQQQLAEAQQTVSHLERRQHIDAMLSEAEAVDLETARLLTERAVEQMSEPDVKLAVEDLRRSKPFLFRQSITTASGAMAARESGGAPVEEAAERAVTTGDRRDLLHYLRMRRQK
ncbi:MAG: hypothetical protein ACODAQ_12410 [Phycisphaeraceae bacterium]